MGKPKTRNPVVAGQFYPDSEKDIRSQISSFVDKEARKADAIACMLPHAGYIYSGRVAAVTVSRVNIKDTVVLLGPNHTGLGAEFSIMTEGVWHTPLGELNIDSALAKQILKHSQALEDDTLAHTSEHSLEVELPILQYFKSEFKIVPITLLPSNVAALKEIGQSIASAIKETGMEKSVTIIASSDMTHYESQAQAEKKDSEAIKAILELDENKLIEKIMRLNISMCGYPAAIVMLSAAKMLGAKKSELVMYQTSDDVTGDKSSVVGYAGIIIW